MESDRKLNLYPENDTCNITMKRSLPTEILQKIFEFVLESDLTARETISSVCAMNLNK